MKLSLVPQYCGGRILSGLYTDTGSLKYKPGDLYKIGVENRAKNIDFGEKGDNHPYIPNTLLEFQHILRLYCYTENGRDGYQGVIIAVTNGGQKQAADYLEQTGFKNMGAYSKHGLIKPNCILWIGDYVKDVYPILKDLPPFKVEVNEKSSQFSKTAN